MSNIAYIRVSTNKQDLDTQKLEILDYCHQNKIQIDEFIIVEMSSKKSQEKRKIVELKEKLQSGDLLISTELSRLGRSMLETITLVLELAEKGIQLIFIRQPELTTFNNATSKLILTIYAYVAETERDFISQRTKAGLENARAKGKSLGRPKNSLSSDWDKDIDKIKKLINNGLPLKSIWIVLEYNKTRTYAAFYQFCRSRKLCAKLQR